MQHGYRAWIAQGNIRVALEQLGVTRIDLATANSEVNERGYWSGVEYHALNIALQGKRVQILVVGMLRWICWLGTIWLH